MAASTDINDAFKTANEEDQHAVHESLEIVVADIIENVVSNIDIQQKVSENEKVNDEGIEEKKDKDKKEEEKREEKAKKEDKEKKEVEPEVPDIPNFNLGISQVDSSNKQKEKDVGEEVDSKKGALVIRLKKKDVNEADKKEKRIEKIGDKLKSPYLQRRVDPTRNTTTTETKVGNWIFALEGDKLWTDKF